MEKIEVRLPRLTQEIYIGNDILAQIFEKVAVSEYDRFLVVIDQGAYKVNKNRFNDLFSQLSIDQRNVLFLTPHPHSKDFRTAGRILHHLTRMGATRRTCVIAIGGGYVADICGFASAIFMRGIHFIQIPTTLMAQGDAIIGKVAINFDRKKNQLGAFYSPRFVFCDTSFLHGFNKNELILGLVEIWKHAILVDDRKILDQINEVLSTENSLVDFEHLVYFSLATKAGFVEKDPEDLYGPHKSLSLGHTLANILESKSKFRHGIAVFYGLLFEILLAHELDKIGQTRMSALLHTGALFEKHLACLKGAQGFLAKRNLIRLLTGDKINSHGTFSFVIPTKEGYEIAKNIPEAMVKITVKKFLNFKFGTEKDSVLNVRQ